MLPWILSGAVWLFVCHSASAQARLFRYIGDDGVPVIASSIPPRFVSHGYEVLNATGQVVRVVAPAPPPEDLARVEQERALLEEYQILVRRYSSVDEIIGARDRRLAQLDANIAILKANIGNLNKQIEDLMTRAASSERAGRAVPPQIFTSLEDIRAELATTENMLQLRLEEQQEIHAKTDADIALFKKGHTLVEGDGRESAKLSK